MGEWLREIRGGRSRRELAELTGLSASHLQKIEEGRSQDLTLSTLIALAGGYGVTPMKLLTVAAGAAPSQVVSWVLQDAALRPELERALGRRVTVEAEIDPVVLSRLNDLDSQISRMASLVTALSSLVIALQDSFERHLGAPTARTEEREEITDLVRSLGRQD